MTGLIAALVALRLVAIAVGWQAYAADYARFRNIAAQVPAGSLVDDVMVGGSPRDSSGSRCSMYRPLMVSLDGAIAPLFANETQQPLRLVGPLRRAVERLPAGHAWGNPQPGYYDDVIAAAGPAGFDYLLVCNVEGLTRPLPPGAGVVARTPLLTLIKLDQPARRDRPSPLSPPSG